MICSFEPIGVAGSPLLTVAGDLLQVFSLIGGFS